VARAARKARGFTLEDAAERLGLTAEFYARTERGYSLPSTASLAQMVAALEVSADVLIGKRPLTAPASGRPRMHETTRGVDSRALKEAIGRGVHQARKALELTQEDAAERIGVSPGFYSRIERGAGRGLQPSATTGNLPSIEFPYRTRLRMTYLDHRSTSRFARRTDGEEVAGRDGIPMRA
jgi:transcriptional regulator with XRE-family HTH domain